MVEKVPGKYTMFNNGIKHYWGLCVPTENLAFQVVGNTFTQLHCDIRSHVLGDEMILHLADDGLDVLGCQCLAAYKRSGSPKGHRL